MWKKEDGKPQGMPEISTSPALFQDRHDLNVPMVIFRQGFPIAR